MRGIFPYEFVANPHRFSPEQAYAEMDGFTYEEFAPAELTFSIVLLPPLREGGERMKGLLFSPGIEPLATLRPDLSDHFVTIANSRWCGYPWSASADAWFTAYRNDRRAAYGAAHLPRSRGKVLIPRQTADFTNERHYRPRDGVAKDIDVLLVARVDVVKNLALLADTLLALRRKATRRYRVAWATGRTRDEAAAHPGARAILAALERALGRLEDYVEPLGRVAGADMPALYTRSRCVLLLSKVEGKNRALAEAQCCDVPVIALAEYNQAAREGEPLFPERAGTAVATSAEAVADAIIQVTANHADFSPRAAYLETGGRMRFFWECLGRFEHFRKRLPHATQVENEGWLDERLRAAYGIGLEAFLYYASGTAPFARSHGMPSLARADGPTEAGRLLELYAAV